MENNTEAIENDLRDESGLSDTEISSASFYGKDLGSSILGRSYRAPDIPRQYIEPTVLDTSLPYVSSFIDNLLNI